MVNFNNISQGLGANELETLKKSARRGAEAFNKDGVDGLSKQELSEALAAYSKFTADDGKLTRRELKQMAKELGVSTRDLKNGLKGIVGLYIEKGGEAELDPAQITAKGAEVKETRPSNMVFTDPNTGEQTIHEFKYDDQGRKIHTDVSTGETIDYSYDGTSKNPASQIAKDKDGNIIEKREFTYDAAGNLASTKFTDENGEVKIIENKPDEAGVLLADVEVVRKRDVNNETGERLAAKTFKYDNGNESVEHKFSYDAQGRKALTRLSDGGKITYAYQGKSELPSEQVYRDKDNNLISLNKFAYDQAGNRVKNESYNANNELESVMSYEYDAQGRVTRLVSENKMDGSVNITETTYLADGGKVDNITFSQNGQVINSYAQTFDANENLINTTDPNEQAILAQFKPDKE
ncbi:hypothetical protein J6E39_03470 [bacterium]|nr:hypothetical protein [bacterium]